MPNQLLTQRKLYTKIVFTLKKLLIVIFLAGLVAAAGAYYLIFGPNVRTDKAVVTVAPGTTVPQLSRMLEPYVRFPEGVSLTARLKKFRRPKAGKYLLRKGMSSNDLINMFRSGRQVPVTLTFNNTATPEQLAGKVARVINADSASILRAMLDPDFLARHGFTRDNAILMYIPNTYKFHYFTSPEQFRERMWKEYRKFWNESRKNKARRLGLTPLETGILASIVQKETNVASEKGTVARVYLNRLRRGMKLQADPTVVFAYHKTTGDTTVIKRVLNKHLAVDSPYNTYKYPGLPPGPIAMPDISTIDAVLNAPRHDYLYFSADPKRPGHHLFAKNLSQHLKNARQYHRHLNRRKIYR